VSLFFRANGKPTSGAHCRGDYSGKHKLYSQIPEQETASLLARSSSDASARPPACGLAAG
jgi:hypothetical protein